MSAEPALTMEQVRRRGLEVLARELGPVGMIRFLQQAETGYGDYSHDRQRWLPPGEVTELAGQLRATRGGSRSDPE